MSDQVSDKAFVEGSVPYKSPEDLLGLTFGSPVDTDLMKVWPLGHAVDPGMLAKGM